MIDVDNPLHLHIGGGGSARGWFPSAPNSRQLRRFRTATEEVYSSSPLWPFRPDRKPTSPTIYEANRRLHRRRGWWFYQMDMLVYDTGTGTYEWRAWGVSYRHPVTFRRAQRDAIVSFDREVAGQPGTDLEVVAAIPREVRRFE